MTVCEALGGLFFPPLGLRLSLQPFTTMPAPTLRELGSVKGQRVLVRVDFNVPQDKKTGAITNTQRIAAALPTIKFLLEGGASLVLMSHLGRPDGKVVEKFSLRPVAAELEKLLGKPVKFVAACVGAEAEAAAKALQPGEILLLENLRFHIEEEGKVKLEDGTSQKADPAKVAEFRASLSRLGDVYVNDAFGTAHRAHSSMVGVNLSRKAAGFLLEAELKAFDTVLNNPKRPLLAILGGAKIADKIPLIRNLIEKADEIIIGGGMAYTFRKVCDGMEIGNSLCEMDMLDFARGIEEHALSRGVKFYLPVDCVVAASRDVGAETKIVPVQEIPIGWYALDIGPASVKLFNEAVQNAKTILWNGPMGVFEKPPFDVGTFAVARAMAVATDRGATTIIGGGDSAAAVAVAGLESNMSHVSTGGGASLEFLEGKELPGVAALDFR